MSAWLDRHVGPMWPTPWMVVLLPGTMLAVVVVAVIA